MQNKLISRILVAVPITVACGVLALIASSTPQSAALHSGVQKLPPPPLNCSARTIAGDYAYTIEGTLLISPTVTLPIHGVSLGHYDGKGNKTQLDHVVVNGQEPPEEWTSGSGTYTVNEDCTGWQEAFINGNPNPIRSHFIIADGGREIREVIDANAVTAVGVRVE